MSNIIEILESEIAKLKREKNNMLIEQIRLREKLKEYQKQVSYYQDQYLELLGESVRPKPVMRVLKGGAYES